MSDYLPLEMVQQVLLRLPIKSILRFSSVCKPWYNLITSPDFISAHLDFIKSLPNNNPVLFTDYSNPYLSCIDPAKRNHVYVLYSDNIEGTIEEYTKFVFPNEESACFMHIVGLCNGLICLASADYEAYRPEDYKKEVIFWNPMIRRYFHLPDKIDTKFMSFDEGMRPPKRSKHFLSDGSYFQNLPCVFGFVFDDIENDYKVLRVHEGKRNLHIVEVFRLSTGLWGELISDEAAFIIFYDKSNQVDLKGIGHWIVKGEHGKSKILTFNVHEEVFGSIGLPTKVVNDDELYEQDRSKYYFKCSEKYHFIFEESLFLIRYVQTLIESPESLCRYDIWKMEEYNVVESWKQVHTWIFDTLMKPLGFRKNGELLWTVQGGTRLVSSNLLDSTSNYLDHGYQLDTYSYYHCYSSSYVESLILLDKTL